MICFGAGMSSVASALPGSGGNFGEYMVGFNHTGVYEGGVRVVPEGRSVGQ